MPYKKGQKWVAQVRINGRRKEKVFLIKREAIAWESDTRTNPETIWPEKTDTVSLFDWSQAYLNYAEAQFAYATYDEKRVAFKRLFKEIDPALPVSELTPGHVQAYLIKQKLERSGYAANKDRKNLVAAWNWGMEYMNPKLPGPKNPCRVTKVSEVRSPRYVPPEDDFWKVYNLVSGQDRVILLAFLHLAARRGEIFRLTWDDVDFNNDQIRLWTRKRRGGDLEYDWLPLTKVLKQALIWWWQKRPIKDDPHIFLCLEEKEFCQESYGKPFKYRVNFMGRLCDRAEVKRFGFHSIRHLTASTLYKLGYPVAVIQAILRHKNPSTTGRYLQKLGTETVREALEGLSHQKGKILAFKPRKIAAEAVSHKKKKPSEEPSDTQVANQEISGVF
jgi:integrase